MNWRKTTKATSKVTRFEKYPTFDEFIEDINHFEIICLEQHINIKQIVVSPNFYCELLKNPVFLNVRVTEIRNCFDERIEVVERQEICGYDLVVDSLLKGFYFIDIGVL